MTHCVTFVSKRSVPILAGRSVSKLSSAMREEDIQEDTNDIFDAFFLVLLCPWDMGTLIPSVPLTWDGLLTWESCVPNNMFTGPSDKENEEKSIYVHKSRVK